jgi:hypothetical protein
MGLFAVPANLSTENMWRLRSLMKYRLTYFLKFFCNLDRSMGGLERLLHMAKRGKWHSALWLHFPIWTALSTISLTAALESKEA